MEEFWHEICEVWWLFGRFVAFVPKGRGFESHSRHHIRTLGKSFTCSCLWRFSVKLRHSISFILIAVKIL